MKKGVIMDIRGRKAVVLTPDGEFSTINLKRNHTLTIGSEIKLAPKPLNKKKGFFTPSMPTLAGMAAILLLVVIVTGVIPVRQNDAVAAYVSFDINPSIEVGVNSDLEIVQYQAWNSDGEGLNLERETMNMPLSEFGGLLVSKLDKEGYLEENGKLLIVASNVETNESDQAISGDLETVIRGIEQNNAIVNQAVAITTILDADYSTHEKAMEHGISQGKYMTYLAAIDRGASLSMDEVRNLSVKKMDEMQSESMTAVEAKETQEPDESKVKDTPAPIEDSVVQLNDKKVPDQDGELILQQSEPNPTPESKDKPSNKNANNDTKKNSSSNGTQPQKAEKQKEEEKQEKAEKKTETKVVKEQEKEKKQTEKQSSKAEKAQEKAEKKSEKATEKSEKKNEKAQEKSEKKNEKAQEKSEKKNEKAKDKEEKKSDKAPKKEDPKNNKGKSEEKKKD